MAVQMPLMRPGLVTGGRESLSLFLPRLLLPLGLLDRDDPLFFRLADLLRVTLHGDSPVIREVFARLDALADTTIDVLIAGETGTGANM